MLPRKLPIREGLDDPTRGNLGIALRSDEKQSLGARSCVTECDVLRKSVSREPLERLDSGNAGDGRQCLQSSVVELVVGAGSVVWAVTVGVCVSNSAVGN